MTVLVTGATGFVGGHLCAELVRQGFPVRGVVRRAGATLAAGVEPIFAPKLTDDVLRRAAEGATSVVHLAARVHVMRESATDPLAEFRAVNVEGTRALAEAARAAAVERFVYLSSIKVNGEGGSHTYVESDAPAPRDPYGQSKLEAEHVIAEVLTGTVGWTVIRPPLVYGPGVGGNMRHLLRLAELSRTLPLPFGAINNQRSLVFVGNLVDAVIAAIRARGALDRAFLISDGEDLSTTDLIRRLANALGGPAKLISVPAPVLHAMLCAAGRSAESARLLGDLRVDSTAIRRALAWRPPHSVSDGLAVTAAWWRERR